MPRKRNTSLWNDDPWLRNGVSRVDLFGDIPVTHADIEELLNTYKHAPADGWRRAYFIKAYDIEGKARELKRIGRWPP